MLENSIKIVMILILAGIIGWDREQHGRPAGFRTHILVGIGSTIIMIVSIMLFEKFPGADGDPGRIAAQVVSGIGFLGAGTILVQGSTVKGLTTAASLWTTAAIGLAVGGGFYYTAIIATFIVFISLVFLNSIEFGRTKIVKQELVCKFDNQDKDYYRIVCEKLEEKDCKIKKMHLEKNKTANEVILKIKIDIASDLLKELNSWMIEFDEIREFSWTEIVGI